MIYLLPLLVKFKLYLFCAYTHTSILNVNAGNTFGKKNWDIFIQHYYNFIDFSYDITP